MNGPKASEGKVPVPPPASSDGEDPGVLETSGDAAEDGKENPEDPES